MGTVVQFAASSPEAGDAMARTAKRTFERLHSWRTALPALR